MPFRETHSTTALPWRKQEPQLASDTLSASVDLEDIIDDFDESSRNQSTGSFSNIQSQTYFSLSGTVRDQDTASFHTALQDGFSLNQLDASDSIAQNQLPYSEDLLWANDNLDVERDSMLPPANFQVSWDDLVYKIKPKITISSLWYDLEQNFKTYLSSSFQLLNCKRSNNDHNSYSTEVNQLYKKEPVTIIQQISGSFKSGELTAVMGPSGAGKTSLLNFLSRRREEGYAGQLYVDNTHRKLKISTIPQNDYLPEYLTVSENLMFASRLKNTQPNYDHEKNIERVSSLLGLDDCLGTRTKKISGGQHKRLSIAQELLSRPDILVLDEPTSGLDSLTCYKTLSVLKNLVKSSARKLIDPIAIVVTIHQPQQEVFDIFDKVYVMANGGIAIYDGPPEKCTQFIEKHSGIQIPSQDYNPASFLIEIASGEYGTEPIKSLERQVQLEFARSRKEFKNKFSVSNIRNKNNIQEFQSNSINQKKLDLSRNSVEINIDADEATAISTQDNDVSKSASKNLKVISSNSSFRDKRNRKMFLYIDQRIAKGSSMNKGNFWLKTRILSERYWISITRDPKQLIARIIFHIFLPICLSLMMGTEPGGANACPRFSAQYELKELVKDDNQTSNDVQHELLYTLENIALLYVLIYALSSANIAATTLSFTLDMQSSLKEFHNGWYSMPAYITARFITDLPVEVCLPILTLVIAYPLSGQVTGNGLSDSYRIIISSVAMILGSMVGATLGMIFGALYVGYVSTALFASQGATLPLVFISGFVVRTKNMSKLVYALSHFSFYRHILEITVIARYGFGVCSCDPKSITGHDAQLTGVPERLRAFTQYWMSAYSNTQDSTIAESSASDLAGNTTNAIEDHDIFQLFAKQISLYNTNGVEVKSCDDVKPFQLYDLTLSESDLPASFLALIILLVMIRFLLLLVVKLVIHFRTSL